jgi:hypothetical protein
MATANPPAFIEALQKPADSHFIALYLRRFLRARPFADTVAKFLDGQFTSLVHLAVDYPPQRVVYMVRFPLKAVASDALPDERLAQIIFGLFLLHSDAGLARGRGASPTEFRQAVCAAFRAFQKAVGIDLLRGGGLDFAGPDATTEAVSSFVAPLPLLPLQVLTIVMPRIAALRATPHEGPACLALAGLLAAFAASATPAAVRFTQTLIGDFLAFPDAVAFSAVPSAGSALSFEALKKLSNDDLGRILTIVIGGIKVDGTRALDLLLNITRAAPVLFLVRNGRALLDAVGGAGPLADVRVLNVVGELAKRVPTPAWFVGPGHISFQSLIPLMVSADPRLQQRAFGIFAVLIFGSVRDVDQRLLFASLMPLFCAEARAQGYAAMAASLLTELQRAEKVGRDAVELLGCVTEPMVAIGGAEKTVAAVLKFLAKVARGDDAGSAALAIALIRRLSAPRHGSIIRTPD